MGLGLGLGLVAQHGADEVEMEPDALALVAHNCARAHGVLEPLVESGLGVRGWG